MSKLLGIDYGAARVGLAISDESKTMAFPYCIVSAKSALEEIKRICEKENIEKIIVGLPITLRSEINEQTRRTQLFIDNLKKYLSVPIVISDERLTSALASRLSEGGKRKSKFLSKTKKPLDDVAAAIILQTYLDRL